MRRSAVARTGAGAALRFEYSSPVFVLPSLKHPLKQVVSAIKRATRYMVLGGASIAGWDRFSCGVKKGPRDGRNRPAAPLRMGCRRDELESEALYSPFSTSRMSSFVGRTR